MNLLQSNYIKEIKKEKDNIELKRLIYEYYKMFSFDDFVVQFLDKIKSELPKVILLCVNYRQDDNQNILEYLSMQSYKNIEAFGINSLDDVNKILPTAKPEYVMFWEKDVVYWKHRTIDLLLSLETSDDDVVICYRDFATERNQFQDVATDYSGMLHGKTFYGRDFLNMCMRNGLNLYGNLSSLLVKKQLIKKAINNCLYNYDISDPLNKMRFLFSILEHGHLHFCDRKHVAIKLPLYNESEYSSYSSLWKKYLWRGNDKSLRTDIKREITFFYTDKGEYYNLLPIAKEGEKRGYKVNFTGDRQQKAEIGVYCQHTCFPENSKFSIILLHDMAQGHGEWPNIWQREHWDKFDVGILPGKEWGDRWSECALMPYVNPRYGTYMLGYPKGDMTLTEDILSKAKILKKELEHEFTVLYAPSWENDGKEDDFVQALHDLPVNMIVKQAPASNDMNVIRGYNPFRVHSDSVIEMRKMHEGNFRNLHYIDSEENVLVPLSVCDLVISDESSVMTEATLFRKPSIAVVDWLIPDRQEKRMASVPTGYVAKCKRNEIRDMVLKVMNDRHYYDSVVSLGEDFFVNKGNCCKNIIDLIESLAYGKELDRKILDLKLHPTYMPVSMWT